MTTANSWAQQIQSVENFRDLGESTAKDGKGLKQGLFFRCGALHKLSEADKALLEQAGIRTVFDFRAEAEAAGEPDILPAGAEYIRYSGIATLDALHQKTGEKSFDMKNLLQELAQNPEKGEEVRDFLRQGYRTMAESSEAFARFLEIAKDPARLPVVFHCTAGKDRTGVAAVLLQLALGFSREAALGEYLKSNQQRAAVNEHILQRVRQGGLPEAVLAVVKELLEVKAEYLHTTLQTIEERYGSVDAFLTDQLGVSAQERLDMQKQYMTK